MERIINEAKVLNIARLAKMLLDLYGLDYPFSKIGKFEGQEIEMYLKELDGYITFILTSDRNNFECRADKANNPMAKIIINVREEKILRVLSNIIKSKANIIGLTKLLKYLIPAKIKIKGSYVAALKLTKCLMIGKNKIYQKNGV
jgi:hypothetical protein